MTAHITSASQSGSRATPRYSIHFPNHSTGFFSTSTNFHTTFIFWTTCSLSCHHPHLHRMVFHPKVCLSPAWLSPNKTEALTTYLKLLGITLDTLSFPASLPTPLYFFVHFKLPSCLPMYQVSASLFTRTPEFLHPHQTYSSSTYCPCCSSAFNHYVILDNACKINTGRVTTCSWTLWPPHPTPFISPFSNLSSPPSRTLHSSPLKTLLPILPEPYAIIINYLLYLATAVVLWCAKSSNTALTIVS